jgi:intein/homing endonuclease
MTDPTTHGQNQNPSESRLPNPSELSVAELEAEIRALMARADRTALSDPLSLACHLDSQVVRRPHLEVIASAIARLTPQGGDRILVICPPQVGKPVYVGALILMGDGSRKPLSDVRVGDLVITSNGRPRRVLAVHEQGPLPTLRIVTASGRTTIANHDHPFLTPNGWVKASDLREGDVLASVPAPDYSPVDELSEDEGRLLGYCAGDGSTSSTGPGSASMITVASQAIDDDIRRCSGALGFAVRRSEAAHSQGTAWGLDISRGARPWLAHHGLAHRMSRTKRVPQAVFTATRNVIANFLGAYFDCDGSIKGDDPNGEPHRDLTIEFHSVSRDLLDDVQHLLLRLGIRSSIRVRNGRYKGEVHKSWRLQLIRTDDIARFRDTIPVTDENKSRHLRDCNGHRTTFDDVFAPNEIIAIEDSGVRECRCLTVEEDHTFTSDDLVVHNSYMACWGVFWWLIKNPNHRVIVGSYGTTLASIRGRTIRRLVEQYGPQYGLELLKGAKSVTNWSLNSAGGVLSAGVGAGITGNPADCVAAGTLVRTPEGNIPIETVAADRAATVLSYNHALQGVQASRVLASRRLRRRDTVVVHTLSGRQVRCTPDHQLCRADGRYIAAADLKPGDELLTTLTPQQHSAPEIELDPVTKVSPYDTPEDVYDIQVEGNENFFANDLLVHNCFLIDDPIRSRADAESRLIRDSVWDWWSGDVNSRLQPGAPVLLVQTRWHSDDLAGRLIAEEGTTQEGGRWQVVYLPAFAVAADPDQGIPPDSLGRTPGQPLSHPKIAPADTARLVAHWEDKRRSATPRDWAALWQGDPRPIEGALITRTMLRDRHDFTPTATPIKHAIAIDPAGGGADNVGIVAGWLGDDLRLYVSHDRSIGGGKGSDVWPDVAVMLAYDIDADRIIYEANYGKNLVRMAITTAWDKAQRIGRIPDDVLMPLLVPVTAKKNKRLRAEPVAQLIAADKVRFAGLFSELESQWTTWLPTETTSPGNLDAMVYLAFNLLRPRRRRASSGGRSGLNPGAVSRSDVLTQPATGLIVPAPRGPDRFALRQTLRQSPYR